MKIKIIIVALISIFSTTLYSQVNNNISIWPIPAKENVYVSIGSSIFDKGFVSIYDLTGKLVKKRGIDIEIGNNISKIDVANLSDGIYIVKISSTEINFTKKIVLQ